MRIRRGLGLLAVAVGVGCSFPVESFTVSDAAKDAASDGAKADTASTDDAPTCSAPTPDLCGGKCTNLTTDSQNCGSCGKVCQSGEKCQVGSSGKPRCNGG